MATLIAELEAVVTADTGAFDSAMTSSGQKVDELGTKGKAAGANFGAASAAMAAGAVGITAGIADAVSMAGNFESAMNEIGSVTGATAAEMELLSAAALRIGQETSFSAQEAALAITELGKAGVPIPDILNGAADATASLAAAGGVDMPRAAEVMSNAMNVFGIEGAKAGDVADTLAGAANTSATSIDQLAYGMAQVGPSAKGLGLSLEETVAQLALFADAGMQGSDAGTSMKTMLARLTPGTKPAKAAFAELGLTTAETANAFFDAQGQFVGMEKASELLYEALAPLTDEQRAVALETIFGSDASRAAELTFQAQKAAVEGTGRGYSSYLEAVQASGQATDVANAKMAGMNGALEALSGSIDTAKIAFGMAFLPVVEMVAEKLAELVNVFIGLDPQIQTVISAVVAGGAAFLAIGSAVGFIVGPLGAFLGLLAPIAAGVAAIALPLALVAAALVALYVAYQTNFLGFADGVNAAIALLTTGFNNLILLVQNVATAFGEGGLGAALQVLSDAFTLAFQNISTAVQTKLQEISTALMTWLNEQGANMEAGWATVQTAVSTAWTTIQTAISTALTSIQTTISEAFTTVQTVISEAWTTIQTTISTAMTTIQEAVSNGWVTIQNDIATRTDGINTKITEIWEGIQTFLGEKMTAIQTALTTAWETIQTTISTALGDIQSGISLAWEAITTGVQTTWQNIQTVISTFMDTIKTTITTKIEEAKTGLINTITTMKDEAITTLSGLKDGIVDLFADAGTWLLEAGKSIIQGLIDGILSMGSAVGDAVASVVPTEIGMPTLDFLGGGGGGGGRATEEKRQHGGPVSAGLSYLVGEQGAELFIPSRSGQIIPHGQSMAMMGAGGGGTVNNFYINTVEVKDGDDLERWAHDKQREQAVAEGRGV